MAEQPRGWRVRTKREGAHELRIAFPPGPRRKGAGKLLEILHPKTERNPKACGVAQMNPAELVIFGNPKRKNATWMRVAGVVGKLVSTRGDTPATVEYQLEKRDGTKVWVKPRISSKKNSSKRRKNPHRAGCGCAICKNARGEKHSPGCGCAVCRRGKNPKRSAPNTSRSHVVRKRATHAGRKRRRNQGEGDSTEAVKLYQAFHGKDPSGLIERQVSDTIRMEYVALGDLEYLIVDPPDPGRRDVKVDFEGDRVKLASSPNGAQLYLIGGNQNLSAMLDKFTDDATKDFIELGAAVEVQYFAHKSQANFQPVSYFHKFGEESGVAPMAVYDQIKKQVFLIGGEYRVEAPGIVN